MSHTIEIPRTQTSLINGSKPVTGQMTGEVLHVDAAHVEKW
jgi:hypothetical protein